MPARITEVSAAVMKFLRDTIGPAAPDRIAGRC